MKSPSVFLKTSDSESQLLWNSFYWVWDLLWDLYFQQLSLNISDAVSPQKRLGHHCQWIGGAYTFSWFDYELFAPFHRWGWMPLTDHPKIIGPIQLEATFVPLNLVWLQVRESQTSHMKRKNARVSIDKAQCLRTTRNAYDVQSVRFINVLQQSAPPIGKLRCLSKKMLEGAYWRVWPYATWLWGKLRKQGFLL